MPDDAKNITASCNKQQTTRTQTADIEKQEMDMLLATTEDEDLNAAILASLMDANNNSKSIDGTRKSVIGEGSGTVGSEDPTSEAIEGSIRDDRDNIEEGYASSDPKPRYDH